VEDLISVATEHGTDVREAWAGTTALGGAITILGPDEAYYEQLVAEQVTGVTAAAAAKGVLLEAARGLLDRFINLMPVEIPFMEKDVSPRNNSAMITLLQVDGRRLLFTADAGVPALEPAWDFAEANGLGGPVDFVQIPHHGSRRNASSTWLDRLLGQTGQPQNKPAFVSCVANSDKHPAGKVVNAYTRRGCWVSPTAGQTITYGNGAPARVGWHPLTPLGPMDESDDDD